jgi:hypothetical protein
MNQEQSAANDLSCARDVVNTGSGSDRVTILTVSTVRVTRHPVATAPGTDHITQEREVARVRGFVYPAKSEQVITMRSFT